jgi:hypothetical protein
MVSGASGPRAGVRKRGFQLSPTSGLALGLVVSGALWAGVAGMAYWLGWL